jgi:predicted dehydrogenase
MEAVRRAGVKLWVHLDNRAQPLDLATRYVIQEGLLGHVVYGDVHVDDNISVPTRMWGDRSREWATGSSTAHFLFSHVSDLMRWYFAPAEVEAVYAISQGKVLGYTPDLYDGYLFFDTGLKVRIKSEWIKHVDGLVEFAMSFSGAEGTLFYHKTDAFAMARGLRANVSSKLSSEDLLAHQQALLKKGIRSHVLMRVPRPSVGGDALGRALEMWPNEQPAHVRLADYILDSILEGKEIPESWRGNGRLPTGEDGLIQTRIVCAIEESARTGREVAVPME